MRALPRAVGDEGDPTGVGNVANETTQSANVVDLNGQRIGAGGQVKGRCVCPSGVSAYHLPVGVDPHIVVSGRGEGQPCCLRSNL